jgi:hypothetical protein
LNALDVETKGTKIDSTGHADYAEALSRSCQSMAQHRPIYPFLSLSPFPPITSFPNKRIDGFLCEHSIGAISKRMIVLSGVPIEFCLAAKVAPAARSRAWRVLRAAHSHIQYLCIYARSVERGLFSNLRRSDPVVEGALLLASSSVAR